MAATMTPSDLVISPRNLNFSDETPAARLWLRGDIVGTAWYNGLSATFPQGERFFIQSVRRFRKDVPDKLGSEIDAFAKQEAHHTREHLAFNRQVADGGYDVASIEARVSQAFVPALSQHPVGQLAITVALEHFTAIFANLLLRDRALLAGASDQVRRLWLWHAVEEVEHKAVAYDTFMHVTRGMKPLARWATRCAVFWRVSRNFVKSRFIDALELMAADGLTGWKARLKLTWYLVGSPGVLRKILPMWASYFLPGFHPWMHDDRDLLAEAEIELSQVAKAAA